MTAGEVLQRECQAYHDARDLLGRMFAALCLGDSAFGGGPQYTTDELHAQIEHAKVCKRRYWTARRRWNVEQRREQLAIQRHVEEVERMDLP